MVDIRDIGASAAESGTIRETVARFMKLKSARAATVRVMPWLLYDLNRHRFLRHFPFPWFDGDLESLPPLFWENYFNPDGVFGHIDEGNGATMGDVFDRHRNGMAPPFLGHEFKSPFQLILHVEKGSAMENEAEELTSLTRRADVFTTIEKRGRMRLQLTSGDGIACGSNTGTLGGFIDNGSGVIYGVTCAHVAMTHRVFDHAGTQIGTLTTATKQSSMQPATVCTPFPPTGAIGATINSGDFALIHMSNPVQQMNASLAQSLHQGEVIDVNGSKTRHRFNVRSLCIAMRLTVGSQDFCYAPLVELYSRSGTTWSGDSGAWGMKNQQSEWAAMVAGADSISTFAFDARDVGQWIGNCGFIPSGSQWSVH